MSRQDDRTARKSDWASERLAGGTDDGHGARQAPEPRRHPMPNRTDEMASRREQASRAEEAATAPSYLPVRRVDEAGRVARSHEAAATQAPISMTW